MITPVQRLALIQPRPGIGDMVWHTAHLRALAQYGQHVTLVTRRRSIAHQLLGPEDGIDDILWVERGQWDPPGARHQGALGFVRLVRDLHALRFDAAICLSRSRNVALAAALARIPVRYGFGIGPQRLLQRGPSLPESARRLHPFDQASAWLAAANVPLPDPEPCLTLRPAAISEVRARLGLIPGSFVALGIACSDAWRRWPTAAFAELATALLAQGWPTIVLFGGPNDQADADAIHAQLPPSHAARLLDAIGWDLRETAALLADSACCVGNDSAVLNIAAAVGIPAYGLFGGAPPLHHSRRIHAITTPDGTWDRVGGMARITVASVLTALAPFTMTATRPAPAPSAPQTAAPPGPSPAARAP